MKKFMMGFLASLAIGTALSSILPRNSHAAAFLADLTLSPVKTVLEIIVSPTASSIAAVIASTDTAADRQEVMNAVAADAADHLAGADKTPLLVEVHSLLRDELAHRGDLHSYSDLDLSKMIAAEISAL